MAGSAASSSIAASGDPLPFLRRGVDVSSRFGDASEVPRSHPMSIVTLGGSNAGAPTSLGEGGRHPREQEGAVSRKKSRSGPEEVEVDVDWPGTEGVDLGGGGSRWKGVVSRGGVVEDFGWCHRRVKRNNAVVETSIAASGEGAGLAGIGVGVGGVRRYITHSRGRSANQGDGCWGGGRGQ